MNSKSELSIGKYRIFWYLAYTYFQNKHLFNHFVAKSKHLLSKLEDSIYKKKWGHLDLRKPIFIIGPHRSGTTILQQILCLHSSIATPRIYSDILDMSPILSKKWVRYFFHEKGGRGIDSIIVDFDSPQEAQGLLLRYFYDNLLYNPTTEDGISNYMRKLLYLEGKTRFLWKVPYLTIKIQETHSLFPDAQFIYLHRDPVTCINSKLKVIYVWQEFAQIPSLFYRHLVGLHENPDQGDLGYFMEQVNKTVNLQSTQPDPIEMAKDHLRWIEKALRDMDKLRSSESCCFLDYSTLISDPCATIPHLLEFLNLADESDAILAKLEELNMPLRLQKQRINYIPKESLHSVEELSRESMQRGLSGIDWKNWSIIGSVPEL